MGQSLSEVKKGVFGKVNCDKMSSDFDLYNDGSSSGLNQAQLFLESKEFNERNPGCFEDMQKNIRDISPQPIDGMKVVINVPVHENSQVGLNWHLSNQGAGKFNPSITYVGDKPIRINERSPVIMSEFDMEGNLGINFVHYLKKNLRLKLSSYTRGLTCENFDTNIVYYGSNYTFSNSLLNPSIEKRSAFFVTQYLRRINQNLDLGIELATQIEGTHPQFFCPSIAFKYRHGSNYNLFTDNPHMLPNFDSEHKGQFLGLVGTKMCHFSYSRYMTKHLQFLATFDHQPGGTLQNISSFGYIYHVPKINITLRSSIDSSYTTQTVVEKTFNEGESEWSFSFSLAHHFPSSRTISGIGLTIGR